MHAYTHACIHAHIIHAHMPTHTELRLTNPNTQIYRLLSRLNLMEYGRDAGKVALTITIDMPTSEVVNFKGARG